MPVYLLSAPVSAETALPPSSEDSVPTPPLIRFFSCELPVAFVPDGSLQCLPRLANVAVELLAAEVRRAGRRLADL